MRLKQIMSVSVDPEQKERIKRDAKELRLSVSAFLRGIYEAYTEAKRERGTKNGK